MKLLFLLLLVLSPCVAVAQAVSVTSGEHPTFTRLVLAVGTDAQWNVRRVEGGVEFRLENAVRGYDLDRAFDLIPRNRIRRIEDRGEGHLFVAFECDCHAGPFDVGGGYVALDIHDGPAPPEFAAFNRPLSKPAEPRVVLGESAAPNAIPSSGVVRHSRPGPRLVLPILPDRPDVTTAMQAPNATAIRTPEKAPFEATAELPAIVEPAPPEPRSTRARDTESALLDQISRAASQGLLEADLPSPNEQTPSPPPQPSPDPPLAPVREGGHVSIITSVDDATREAETSRTDDGNSCYPDRYFQVSDWGAPLTNGADIGRFRSDIIGEFDEADGAGVTALVRHYIYITFGAEALVVLERYADDIERPDILTFMAEIMDDGRARAAVEVIPQMACDGLVSLWAAAAQPALYKYQTINGEAIRRTFLELPPHLRRHLGPTLAAKFLALGDTVTADTLQSATARVFETPTANLGLLEARRDLADGRPDAAQSKLDDILPRADDLLPDALIERVEAALAHGDPVPDDLIRLVESVGFEHRGTETGAALALAEIRALASAARYAEAFQRLEGARSDGTATGKVAIDLSREVFALLVIDPSDEEFLSRAVSRIDEAATLPAKLRRAIARRFLDLGFPAPARSVLDGAGALPEAEDRMIYARIALAQSKPNVAVGYLAGLGSREAMNLRAAAMSMARDHAGARAIYEALGDEEEAIRQAWLGADWEQITQADDPQFGPAGNLMTTLETSAASASAPPLARSETLIEASRLTRTTLETLLATLGDPPEGAAPQDP